MIKGQRATAIVRDWQWTESQSGTAGLKVFCEVTDPNGLADPVNMNGSIWFTPKAMKMAKRQLKNLGMDTDKFPLEGLGVDVNIIGNALDVMIDEYNGQLKVGYFGIFNATPPVSVLKSIGDELKKVHDDDDKDSDDHSEKSESQKKSGDGMLGTIPF